MTTGRVARRRLLWTAAMIIALIGPPLVAIGLRTAAVAERFPQITLVPAHDVRGFAGLPRL